VPNLARPGGNITGLSMAGTDLESKRLELLKDAVPAIKKVMILHDLSMGPTGVSEAQAGARALGLESFFVETGDDAKLAEVSLARRPKASAALRRWPRHSYTFIAND
jgi:ABC-type uncharacterized transport system substrate-binding protein